MVFEVFDVSFQLFYCINTCFSAFKFQDYQISISSDVDDGSDHGRLPVRFRLHQNIPNPFNPSTTIRYELPRVAHVRLSIYNLSGREIRVLVDDPKSAGFHDVIWDGKNEAGLDVPAGLYVYRIKTKRMTDSKKLLLIK